MITSYVGDDIEDNNNKVVIEGENNQIKWSLILMTGWTASMGAVINGQFSRVMYPHIDVGIKGNGDIIAYNDYRRDCQWRGLKGC